MKPKVHKGVYYFPTYQAAREAARWFGLATDRFISYELGWAIQREVSGPYYGPGGWS